MHALDSNSTRQVREARSRDDTNPLEDIEGAPGLVATTRAGIPGGHPDGSENFPAVSDEEVVEAIILASRALVGLATRTVAQVNEDLTLPQYRALVVLATQGTKRLADLADALGVNPSTATRMCDRLVRKNLIVRTRDTIDRREVQLVLSETGRALVGEVLDRRRRDVAHFVKTIPSPMRHALVDSLTLLTQSTDDVPEQSWAAGWRDR
jgi:DNA-binding MarR family transcriptional regulator